MRSLALAFIVASASLTGVIGQSNSPLDSPVGNLRNPESLPRCGIATLISQLARSSRVLIGFERTADCTGASSFPRLNQALTLVAPNTTVRETLDHLMLLAPEYKWAEVGGIAVIRPARSWADPNDPLNMPVPAFAFDQVNVTATVARILSVPVPSSVDTIGDSFAVSFRGGTLMDALNALIRAQGGVTWDAGLIFHGDRDASPTINITIRTFTGGGITMGTPLPRLLASLYAQ